MILMTDVVERLHIFHFSIIVTTKNKNEFFVLMVYGFFTNNPGINSSYSFIIYLQIIYVRIIRFENSLTIFERDFDS